MATADRAVVFSGVTVGIGLLALEVLPVPFLRATGVGGVLIPLVSVGVAVTLLPVLLATAGPRLDWPRIRTDDTAGVRWTRWAQLTFRRRGMAATAGTLVLIALIVPALAMHVGEPSSAALAQSGTAHDAPSDLEGGGMPSGVLTPITILTTDAQASAVADRIDGQPGVFAVLAPVTGGNRQSGTALVTVLPVEETSTASGQQTVEQIRADLAAVPAVLGIGGSGAAAIDFATDVYGSFPAMLVLIALVTFLLLPRPSGPGCCRSKRSCSTWPRWPRRTG